MKHIPNILTCLRIALIPFFVWQMLAGHLLSAGGILILSGLTDLLDGLLARRFNWVSALGKVLDPVADKLTQVTVCVMLIVVLRQYWYFFAIMLFKDFVMLVLGGYLLKNSVRLEGARWFGKVSTFVFYGVMTLILLMPPGMMPHWLIIALLCVSTVCALCAAILYIPQFLLYRNSISTKNKEDQTA